MMLRALSPVFLVASILAVERGKNLRERGMQEKGEKIYLMWQNMSIVPSRKIGAEGGKKKHKHGRFGVEFENSVEIWHASEIAPGAKFGSSPLLVYQNCQHEINSVVIY